MCILIFYIYETLIQEDWGKFLGCSKHTGEYGRRSETKGKCDPENRITLCTYCLHHRRVECTNCASSAQIVYSVRPKTQRVVHLCFYASDKRSNVVTSRDVVTCPVDVLSRGKARALRRRCVDDVTPLRETPFVKGIPWFCARSTGSRNLHWTQVVLHLFLPGVKKKNAKIFVSCFPLYVRDLQILRCCPHFCTLHMFTSLVHTGDALCSCTHIRLMR